MQNQFFNQVYTLNYPTAGQFDINPKWAEQATSISQGEEWRGDARMRYNVLVCQGKVYITNELMTILGGRGSQVDAHIGKAYLYNFSKHFDELMERQEYPSRNAREEFVTRRNLKIIELLMGLV